MLSQAAMAPVLFILGAAGLRYIRWRWPGLVRKLNIINWGDEPGLTVELYRGKPAWPVITAMLMQNFSDNLLFIMIASDRLSIC